MFNTARYDAAAAAIVAAAAAAWKPKPAVAVCQACEADRHEASDTAIEFIHTVQACDCPCNTRRQHAC